MPGLFDALLPASPGETPVARDRRHRCARVALLAAAGCFLMSAAMALAMPQFFGIDERAHLAYTASVVDGRLPHVDDPFPVGPFDALDHLVAKGPPRTEDHGTVWVANHPPLLYVASAPAAWLAERIGIATGPLLSMRLLNAAGMAVGVALSAAVAHELLPRREPVAAGTAVLVGLTAQVQHAGSYAYNDGLALATAAACLVVAFRLLRRGPSRALLLAGIGAAALAAATRAATLPAVALVLVAWCTACVRDRSGSSRREAVLGAGALVAAPALAAGWFFLLNWSRYGSLTADTYLLEKFDRVPHGTTWSVLTTGQFDLKLVERLWTAHRLGVDVGDAWDVAGTFAPLGWGIAIPVGLLALAVIGWIVTAVRHGVARPSLETGLVAGAAVAWVLALLVGVASFVADGGGAHPRYLIGSLPVVLAPVAAGLYALAPRAGALVAAAGVLLAVDLVLVDELRRFVDEQGVDPAFDPPGVAGPIAVGLVIAAVAAFGAALLSLVRASGRADGA